MEEQVMKSLNNPQDRTMMDHLMKFWSGDSSLKKDICGWVEQEAQQAQFANLPANIHPALFHALKKNGIEFLYSHQALSWEKVVAGGNVVITTGTASGKSLCYQLPILQSALTSPQSTSLLIFPTKALAQDQLNALQHLIAGFDDVMQDLPLVKAAIYDGDTPTAQRQQIRRNTRVLITNPDMLHMAMLPHHTLWDTFFSNLRFVVIDEIHMYRGVFGSNIINLLRRLKRVCGFYGVKPQFIMTSATIANPEEHAGNLIEEPVHWIKESGSPKGSKHFILLNPPVIHPELGIRQSPAIQAIRLTSDLLAFQQQTLIFVRTRRAVEILIKELKNRFPDINIQAYRSGYLPGERRQIEGQLRSGETRVAVATNALELGIDIGGMNAVLLVGYPGTIAATVQQSGRAGRKKDSSVAVLIASQNPLDQYLMKHPEFLLDRTPEQARCDPDNLLILLGHLRCAAFELPFRDGEHFGKVPDTLVQGLLMFLVNDKQLHKSNDSYFWTADKYPADNLNLRTGAGMVVSLKAEIEGKLTTVGTVDAPSAIWMVHPDAVYLHQGESYLVRELDLELGQAVLQTVSVDYYTEPRNETTIEFANATQSATTTGSFRFYGDIRVQNKVTGYKKVRWSTNEILESFNLDMPPNTLDTTGYWFTLEQVVLETLRNLDSWSSDSNQYGLDWPKIRKAILQRDGYQCVLCGSRMEESSLHIHHKTPFRTFTNPIEANQPWNLVTLCPTCHHRAELVVRTRSGLNGLKYVLLNLAPLFVMCDPTDLGSFADPKAGFADNKPAVMVYDQVPGGIGLSQALFQTHEQLLSGSRDLVSGCPCEDGCPGCVGPAGENGTGGKIETLTILKALTE